MGQFYAAAPAHNLAAVDICRFVNFWKGDTQDEEFRRLLTLVRGEEEPE